MLLMPDINGQVKTLKTAENGFQYYEVYGKEEYCKVYSIISLNGDTIIKTIDSFYKFLPDSIFGGYFVDSHGTIKGLSGNCIFVEGQLVDFKRTKENKAYFIFRDRSDYSKAGVCDLNGNVIIKPRKKFGQKLEYDDLKNEFYLSINHGKKKKYLGVSLPDLDYAYIATANLHKMKESMRIDDKITITDKDIEGFFYKEIKKGLFVGILDYKGDEIIPLSKGYSVIDFISLKDGLGCFRVQKDNYIGICDLTGNMVIPFNEKLDQITFYEGLYQEDSGIPGFFLLERGSIRELRDMNGNIIIPFERNFKFIEFHGIKGKIGYFIASNWELSDNDYAYDMSGECFVHPNSYPYKRGTIGYHKDKGFVVYNRNNYKQKEFLGITLTKDGIADYSMQQQINAEKENKRRRRAQYWSNLGMAFLQVLAQTAQATAYAQSSISVQSHQRSNNKIITSQISDPQYSNQVYQQLMAMSIAQVQQQEMAEYQQVRQNYLNMGKDLSISEFRTIKGQAIMDAKNQEYSNNDNLNNKDSGIINISSQTSGGFKCAYCNGTGRIVKNDNAPASFGLSKANKKCNECGKTYDPTVFNHYHVQCGHCGGTGKMK